MYESLNEVEKYLSRLSVIRKDYRKRLETVSSVLQKLGNPQNNIPAIHVAGTSGKGSTSYYAASLLQNMGYSVGLAVSPHVNSVTERSQVNGAPLEGAEYCKHFADFVTLVNDKKLDLSYIEFLNIFTFWLFDQLSLDYMVIEVGLGGRLDPTNVIARSDTIRAITDIGFDHMEMLGNTLSAITSEKAGIIHPQNEVVIHQQSEEIMSKVLSRVDEMHANLSIVHEYTLDNSKLPSFQQRNLALALEAVNKRLGLDGRPKPSDDAIRKSAEIIIPGRFEEFIVHGTRVIVDAAHNPQKIKALTEGLKESFGNKPVVYVVAFGKNKPSSQKEILEILYSGASGLVITGFSADADRYRLASNPELVKEVALSVGYASPQINIETDPHAALDFGFDLAKQKDAPLVITGSFFLVGAIRSMLAQRTNEPRELLV